ncbi:ABC transporter substrate-binding protein [Falsiroseomonas sp.]|uniref:ABC transporter substrate-binding protein n=1 Tax=Falsiroseomonas sp. TaxID=2870721 RepID=UPI00356A9202
MHRRTLLAAPFLAAAPARAQPSRPLARIGWLTAQREASLTPFLPALRAGLAEARLVEGRNLEIAYRFGDDDAARLPALLAELVRLPVHVLLAQGVAVAPVIRARPPVPVVFVMSSDPVAAGLAESLARPAPGTTGVTFLSAEMNGKRVELLRDLLPGLTQLAILANPAHPGEAMERAVAEGVAARFGIATAMHHTRNAAELELAFARLAAAPPGALLAFADGFALQNRAAIARFAMALRIPLVSGWRAFAEAGALLSYGPVLPDSYRRLAHFVDRILRGTRPEAMPIEQPRSFELVVNQRTAAAIGLEVPTHLLARAEAVIE